MFANIEPCTHNIIYSIVYTANKHIYIYILPPITLAKQRSLRDKPRLQLLLLAGSKQIPRSSPDIAKIVTYKLQTLDQVCRGSHGKKTLCHSVSPCSAPVVARAAEQIAN